MWGHFLDWHERVQPSGQYYVEDEGFIRKVVEYKARSKTASNLPPWLLPLTFHCDRLLLGGMGQNKPSLPQVDYLGREPAIKFLGNFKLVDITEV